LRYKTTNGEWFFCGADDLRFEPDWLIEALKLKDTFMVIGTNDLHHPAVISGKYATHFLVKRDYIEKAGGTFTDDLGKVYFEYKHNYTDTELISKAQALKVFTPCLESVVEHVHPKWSPVPMDESYLKSEQTMDEDAKVYKQRLISFAKKMEQYEIPKICIGLPTMASVHPMTMMTILFWMKDAYEQKDYELIIAPTINEQPVDNARNHIVRDFLASDATHLFFVDSDTIPPPDALRKLLAHDKDIVSALTPIVELDEKTGEYYRKMNCVDISDQHMKPNDGLRLCKGAGGSCIMIKRHVFEKLPEPWYRFLKKDDGGKVVDVSEDIYFVVTALAAGIRTWADTEIVCKHYKSCLF
jgi:hypothetical protein